MQVVEAVFPYTPIRDPDAAGSLVLAGLVIGFPVALALSWFLEITPPSLRREVTRVEAKAAEGPAPKAKRSDSVAILPFQNQSGDPDNEYFSDGITDDIIGAVAHVGGLRVLSRTSVVKYRKTTRSVGEIAGELGVATIVTGSVRRSGNRVRIFAEVVDATTEDVLWLETYDRELEDIFQIQSDVAAQIAKAVEREFSTSDASRIKSRGTTDPEAYDLYLQARALWSQRTAREVGESIDLLERVIERDAGFALAHVALAEAHMVLGLYGERAPTEVFAAARKAASAALVIDPELGEAVAAEACVQAIHDWSWSAAEAGFERAIGLSPSYATAHQWYALNVLTPRKRFDEARASLDRAHALDPQSGAIATGRGIISFYARDLARARREFEVAAKAHPSFPLVHFFMGQCQSTVGETAPAISSLRLAADRTGESSESLAALGHVLAQSGEREEARQILKRLVERSAQSFVSPLLLAQVLIGLGQTSEALAQIDEALSVRSVDLIWIGVRPVYDPLRSNEEFQRVLNDTGLG